MTGQPPKNDRGPVDPERRNLLIWTGRTLGAGLLCSAFPRLHRPLFLSGPSPSEEQHEFRLHPHFKNSLPLDPVFSRVPPGHDEFPLERTAEEIARILEKWSASLLADRSSAVLGSFLSPDFRGGSLRPTASRVTRSDSILLITHSEFSNSLMTDRKGFEAEWLSDLHSYNRCTTAQFQIVSIEASGAPGDTVPGQVRTRIRYEIVAAGESFYREQRVGLWEVEWELHPEGRHLATRWKALEETKSRAQQECFADIARTALGGNACFEEKLNHGADYWRTILDGASGIDIYGHNGVSVGDIDGDGFDDLYVCQAAGLPNRLFRNRGDGTFDDITEHSGLGLVENTACALIADVDNDGRQDVIVVCASGPKLFLNQGHGRFRERPNAFQFAQQPRGTFTGAAMADYDRDGWLDVYFCLYVYYQGSEQYKYPLPYHDAENGPPNFFFRNNRDGTFKDVTEQAGLNAGNSRYSFCCGWSDFNGDGWPDLYVVNDFGRKNLYRNNGNGTFTDVSAQAGVEDVGAGMSVCWLDYNRDGNEDLYVANMWTAAGMRVAAQPQFQTPATAATRAQYAKHAMGNSLYRNTGDGTFAEDTISSGVGVGRWSWSSDSWDFDHDGCPDIYVANGMVSGAVRDDLNSFFWRQVVAKSPLQPSTNQAYEQGWSAINELIRSDYTWSGYERNVFYLNHGNGTFSDVSGALGLDFLEDGRAFAITDFDHDGRQEVFLKNRNAPQVRVLKNVVPTLPSSIAFRLEGTRSNRDAIGAVITVTTEEGSQSRSIQAGSGFLSQHSKELLFGLGKSHGSIRATIRWPSGAVQEFSDLKSNTRMWIKEGSPPLRAEAFAAFKRSQETPPAYVTEVMPAEVDTQLLDPVEAPDFSFAELGGHMHKLSDYRGKLLLLHFWSSDAPDWKTNLRILQQRQQEDEVHCFAMQVGGPTVSSLPQIEVPLLRSDEDVSTVFDLLFRSVFDRHRDLPLPTTFLLNRNQEIEKIYQGRLSEKKIQQDLHAVVQPSFDRIAAALPFKGVVGGIEFRRNYLSFGSIFFQRGYFEQARAAFARALADDPTSAEALYGSGSADLQLNRLANAQSMFQRATKAHAEYPATLPNAWNNLGLIATKQDRMAEAIDYFREALAISPDHLVALQNLGNAYRTLQNWPEAQRALERAVKLAPDNAEANYSLAMAYAPQGDADRAYQYLERSLEIRPEYPEALNNLGILLLRTKRVNEAISEFEKCIQVDPDFEPAYLNLARVYAIEQRNDEARALLQQLLQRRPDDLSAKQMLEQLAR